MGTEAAKPKLVDRLLRDARIAQAKPYIRPGDTVLDVGCADGELFRRLADRIGHGIGIEPTLDGPVLDQGYELLPGRFPADVPSGVTVDTITMLAVLEHIPLGEQARLADACAALLGIRGRIVITVPSPRVDQILHVLIRLRLIAGMAAHEHYGFSPADTLGVFPAPRYRVLRRTKFQLGLNNLFVFERAA